MKIILINGSPRKSGATGKILTHINKKFENYPDAEIDYIQLQDLAFSYCIGCSQCFKLGSCHMKDDAELLSQKIDAADMLIIGSPTYESSMPGQLKAVLDRGHYVMEQLFTGKQTMSIATYENSGGAAVVKSLNQLFLYSGGILNKGHSIKVGLGKNPLINKKIVSAIDKSVEKIYKNVKSGKPNNLPNSLLHWGVFNIGIKPHILKNRKKSKAIIALWEKRGIKV